MKTDHPSPAGKALPGCSILPPMDPPSPISCAVSGNPQGDRGGRNYGVETPTACKATPNRKRTQANGKRWLLLNAFVDAGGTDLRPNDWRVWLVLFRDTRDNMARTSQNYIAKRLGLDRKTIGRAVKRLQAAGLLDVLHRGGFRRGPSTYRLHSTPADNAPLGRH